MRRFGSCFLAIGHLPLLALSAANIGPISGSILGVDKLAENALTNLKSYAKQNNSTGSCTVDNALKRREWGDLSKDERRDYINAVLCLSKKSPKTSLSEFPGVRNRYDDFVATHINQTVNIHATSKFLPWHRYYVWSYENALRTECGYNGSQPYYNWAKWANDPESSPIFDGSSTSMSGNGIYANVTTDPMGPVHPRGRGGGCVNSGPFTNFTVNLGPVAGLWNEVTKNPLFSGRGYNPRCLRRDILKQVSSRSTSDANVTDLITSHDDYVSFQTVFEATPIDKSSPETGGVHWGGHYTWGGDPGGDFFVSPGDPMFWFHHASIDRTWWTWQNLKPENRTYEIGLTLTMFNFPPSRNGSLEDGVDLGVNGRELRIGDTMSSVKGPFCYVYV